MLLDKVLITGANGGLGKALQDELSGQYAVLATSRATMDVTDREIVEQTIKEIKPEIVFHCAAVVNADLAQREKRRAYAVNVLGTENVVRSCRRHDATIVFISSDYVFDGHQDRPYSEEDLVEPINYYGITKILAEQTVRDLLQHHYIVRCSWLFGPNGHTFLQKIASKGTDLEIRVVNDQIGSPTYTPHLAKAISELIQTNLWGTYHITNEGYCSWAEYAKEIIRLIGSSTRIIEVNSSEYETLAVRPFNSRLLKEKLYSSGVTALPHWKDALEEFFLQYR